MAHSHGKRCAYVVDKPVEKLSKKEALPGNCGTCSEGEATFSGLAHVQWKIRSQETKRKSSKEADSSRTIAFHSLLLFRRTWARFTWEGIYQVGERQMG